MELTEESRALLADIFGHRDQKIVEMDEGELDKDCIKMIEDLENKKIIKNLQLGDNKKKSKMDVAFFTRFSFEVPNWKKLDDYGMQGFRQSVTEPYGFDKQVEVIKDIITKKARKLDNPEITLRRLDVLPHDDHVHVFDVIDALVERGFIEQISGSYYLTNYDFEISIRLKNGVPPVEKPIQPISQKPKPEIVQCKKQFHFKSGVLFKDHGDDVMIFKNENSLQYKLLRCAFALPIGEQLDGATDDLDMSGRQIPDTARHLNEEIEKVFGTPLFDIDYPNKSVKRIVE